MKQRTVYLSGPIDHCTDEEIYGWRKQSKIWLTPHFTIDPSRRAYPSGEADISDKDLVEWDKVDISNSDAMLVHFVPPAAGSFMTGTTMEIIYAHSMNKLVVTVVNPGFRPSPWIRYHSNYLTDSLKDGIDFLRKFWDEQAK